MFINESFLSFIWQFQYFSKNELVASTGETVTVLSPGHLNYNSGPDFSNAVVKSGKVTWHGNVEIHVKSSNWLDHKHEKNPGYDNVILHVVWEDDCIIYRTDGTVIPAIELIKKVDNRLIYKYHSLVESRNTIPCDPEIKGVREVYISSMLDRVLVERIKEKSEYALELLVVCNYDWEELSYRLLAGNFGFKINQHPMMALATYLPFRIIKKHSENLQAIEALMFGTAGFLKEKPADEYQRSLLSEYRFLSKKYGLNNDLLKRHQWKFMRTRPGNFPTLRISQLASFLHNRQNIFSYMTGTDTFKEIMEWMKIKENVYWQNHYDFGKKNNRITGMGIQSLQGLIINTFIPVLGAYGIYMDDDRYIQKAVELLHHIPAEHNSITSAWSALLNKNHTAADSQSLIHLYNSYCIKKKCLNCVIGMKLLRENDIAVDS